LAHRVCDLELQVLVLEERARIANAVLEERGHFVEQLQRKVIEVKSEKERYTAMMEQQHLQLQFQIKHLERELDEVKLERENPGNIVEKQVTDTIFNRRKVYYNNSKSTVTS